MYRYIHLALLLVLCGCQNLPLPRPDLDRPKPQVTMGPLLQVSKSPYVQAVAIGADGKAHLLVTQRHKSGWSTCDAGTVSHVVVSATGVEHEETLYEKPPCKLAEGKSGGYAYDLAFDSRGRLHAVALDRSFVREGGRWREDPGNPCEKFSRGSGELACAFTIGAKDIGVSTVGRQFAGSMLVMFLTLGHAYRGGPLWAENIPRRIAIARLGASGWGDITVLEADDVRSGSMDGREATLVTDTRNRLQVAYRDRFIDDLAASITGEGELKRATADGKEIALPMRKAAGKEAKGLTRRGFENSSFAIDSPSGHVIRLSRSTATKERAAQLGAGLFGVVVVESQLGEGGNFASPQEVFAYDSSHLGKLEPVWAPRDGFQFAIPIQTASASNGCEYEVRYYVWQQERWSAPLTLDSGVKKDECFILDSRPLTPRMAFDTRGRGLVAWSSTTGVFSRWMEFHSDSAR
jgi:hypothetical protein